MKQQILISLLVLLSVSCFAGAVNLPGSVFYDLTQSKGVPYRQDRLIVRFVDMDAGAQPPAGPAIRGPWARRTIRTMISDSIVAGATVDKEYDGVASGLTVVSLPAGTNVLEAFIKFNESGNVSYAEPDYGYKLFLVPNDPNFPDLWGLDNTGQTGGTEDADIDAPEAWDIHTGDPDLIVAIADTGVDYKHPDLADNMWVNTAELNGAPNVDDDGNGYVDDIYGYDFAGASATVPDDGDSDPCDSFFHGTHVAGIVGAVGDNGEGVAGVCWNVKMMALKVFADDFGVEPEVFASDAVEAIAYAVDNGAKIINASWGGDYYSQSMYDAIKEAGDAGLLFAAAAGNDYGSDNDLTPVYPASFDLDNMIAVMSTDHDDQMSVFSNFGATSVDIAEPGTDILSTSPTYETFAMLVFGIPTDYALSSGTSMSAPHVSGACALIWSQYPALPHQIVKGLLLKTADPVLTSPRRCLSGGRVNLEQALTLIPSGRPGRVRNSKDDPTDPGNLYTSMQAAIDEASNGDVLIAEANTLFIEAIDFKGKAITIRSGDINEPSDPAISPDNTFILGLLNDGSAVTFANNEGPDTILRGFTISWGNADYGGGIRCHGASPTITDCIISNNFAKYYGAGIDCLDSSPTITNCTITNNQTSGNSAIGGGINCEYASPTIADCLISYNFADNVGGGIACYYSDPTIFNCFIANNSAVYKGGGIDLEYSSPLVTNCTIVVDDPNASKDGGIFAYHDSVPVITNCILWGNGDDLYNCSAAYSCIEDIDSGAGNIHLEPTFTTGPLGNYYLSQTAAGQLIDSTCVDLGDPDTDPALGIHTRTTRTDGVTDGGVADMGAHYAAVTARLIQLNITVVDANAPVDPGQANGHVDPNSGLYRQYEVVQLHAYPDPGYRIKAWTGTEDDSSAEPDKTITLIDDTDITIEFEQIPLHQLRTEVIGGHGTIQPLHRRGEYYLEGTVVTLTATPDKTYIVDRWVGTDDDASYAGTNTVTIDSDKEVTVQFRQPKSLDVPAQYPSIALAIDAAYDHGDKVVVSAGTYPGGYDFMGKALTIASEYPDDPACVATTIIDCANVSRAFMFQSGEGRDSVVDGFTIVNGSAGILDPNTPIDSGGSGSAGENALGGAITCLNGSSPTLSNLVIRDSSAWGQIGEDASLVPDPPAPAPPPADPLDPNDQLPDPDPNDPNTFDPNNPPDWSDPNAPIDGMPGLPGLPGEPGADGADGAPGFPGGTGGVGYGGAMYFDANSTPLILNCTMINCSAIGGNGGFGGQGQDGQDGQEGQPGQQGQQGQNGDPDAGAGGDGGDGADGGPGGSGGRGGDGGRAGDAGEALGGAIYFGPNCRPTIRHCTILNCSTRQALGSYGGAAGNGGSGGNGGTAGEGGEGGDGDPEGEEGGAGGDGPGGNGGDGGIGGDGSLNGLRSWAGAIYYGENCEVDISDTTISYNATTTAVQTAPYAGGAAGAGGGGGPGGGPGAPGMPGLPAFSLTSTHGGANYYDIGCKARLTNCTINYNSSEQNDGGGEYYAEACTPILDQSELTGNFAIYGAAQYFDPLCSVELIDCDYADNTAGLDGGGLFWWSECSLDIKKTRFTNNFAFGSGGGVYGGGAWDPLDGKWYNASTMSIEDSRFRDNEATFGGGLYWHGNDSEVAISYCTILDNTADNGGGLHFSNGAPRITGCTIRNNTARSDVSDPIGAVDSYGGGGGAFCWSSDATFEGCTIRGNVTFGSGGGLYLGGDPSVPVLRNCLVRANTAVLGGGGIASYWFAEPTIANCTIVENVAYDADNPSRGRGGGLACSYESNTTLIDSILWRNKGVNGSQIAIGSDTEPVYLDRPAVLTVSHCDIQGGQAPEAIHVEPERTLNWLGGNINADPLFVGSYQLSQTAAGQSQDSPAIDAGSDLAANLGMELYTTRTDLAPDSGVVDMGLHYMVLGPEQELVVIVVGPGTLEVDPNTIDPAKTVYDPDSNTYTYTYKQNRGSVVKFTAMPEQGYRVLSWSGTDKEPSWNTNSNTLTVDGSEVVRVEFEPDITRNLLVPSQYRTIEQAVQAADQHGTNIIVDRGTHYVSSPNGIDFQGKNVTLMSTDPDDPDVIANTIIDCQADRFVTRRAFHFHSGEDHNTIVTGFTIRNAYIHGGIGAAGRFGILTPEPYERIGPNQNDAPRAERGADAVGDAHGGGILCENGSSPTIKNCVITNCTVTGAWGGNGAMGIPTTPQSNQWSYLPPEPNSTVQQTGDGQFGGHAGSGSGIGHGGAIACLSGSCPIITDCIIRDNFALGGCGGTGGDGGVSNGLESSGGTGGDALGDGVGGGIYCDDESCPVITDCSFINNVAATGTPGPGGAIGAGNARTPAASAGFTGFTMSFGGIAGGAAYYDRNCDPNFARCVFSDNKAYELDVFTSTIYVDVTLFYTYTRGGALYSAANNTVTLDDCEFTANLAGAVYCSPGCALNVRKCSFKNNAEATDGGAIYAGSMVRTNVKDSSFMGNSATGYGGAFSSEGDADFTDCAFAGNTAGEDGGAVDAYYDTQNPDTSLALTLNFTRCTFAGNQASQGVNGWGGGVYLQDFDATFTDCYFMDNVSKNGAGLFLSSGTVTIDGGAINSNRAMGGSGIDTSAGFDLSGRFGVSRSRDMSDARDMGGGIVCANANATIENCTLSDNVVDGVNASGGAINFYGGYVTHLVKNCLLTGNSAGAYGGAISCNSFAKPEIANCTFSENKADDLGGAIFCDWSSDATITDSIFQECGNTAIVEEDFGDSPVEYCLFNNNSDGDYGVYDTITRQTNTSTGPDLDITNVDADPLFVVGPFGEYYLGQIASGQQVDSPALNAGSDLAAVLDLSGRTTSTDGAGDSGTVDIGYHYRDHTGVPMYTLTVTVADGRGTAEPAGGSYYAGMPVIVTAVPEKGWRVASWSGTIDDTSRNLTNAVIMGPDRDITLWFDQPRTFVVGSDPNYTTIQAAIDAAADGDVVMLPTGTYVPPYPYGVIQIADKGVTLTSVNPDSPQTVGTTVLRGYVLSISTLQSEAIIDGITITAGTMNIYSCSPTVRNCVFANCNWFGADGVDGTSFVPDDDGYNGVSVQGGAMEIVNGSPTVQNCMFTDCSVTGGDGGRGADGISGHPVGFDGGWAGWAYGGAVYCGFNSNPTFTDCSFSNCFARGGNGGNGGTGTGPNHGGRGGTWEWSDSIETGPMTIEWFWWDGWHWAEYDPNGLPFYYPLSTPYDGRYKDYWKYSGYGGAIYCENESSPKFVDCVFTNNRSYSGVSGRGGDGGAYIPTPDRRLNIESFGGTIYACNGSNPELVNCAISNSFADMSFDPNTIPDPNATVDVNVPDDVYISYGGAVAFEDDCSPKFTNCNITTSEACIGGAMYWSNSDPTIIDCNITDSTAYHGAGLYSAEAAGTIIGSTIARNRALIELPVEPNDPNIPIAFHPGMIFGQGGGYYGYLSSVNIEDSIFADNEATGSGGGIYYYGGEDPERRFPQLLHNSLITGNTAGNDGGGISTNWYAELTISNSTIADNEVTGAIGYGGGVYCGYDSYTEIINSIIWGNRGVDGSQVAVVSGFEYEPRPARVSISYSDIEPQPDPNTIQMPTKLDVVFCIDTTASMWDDIDAVKAASIEIIDEIAAKSPDYRVAVVDYRDFPDGTHGEPNIDYAYNDDLDFETDVATIRGGINSLALGSGADWRESVYSGVMHSIDANSLGGWRPGSDVARVIILIGDAPPHDPEPTTGYTLPNVIAAAGGREPKAVFAIPVDGDPITTAYFSLLAEGTGGAVLDAADANEVVDAVIEAIELVGRPSASIYVEEGCVLDWWNAASGTWAPDSHNIGDDPYFAAGYYLSQTASGQLFDSPCVDIGSDDASDPNIGLGNYTTRTDGVYDVNLVDLGYHYTHGLIGYRLTVTVIEDPNDPGIHGYVDPNVTVIYEGFDDTAVTLTAYPLPGYKVKRWTGTDDDVSTSRINTVTVTQDKTVTVEFEPAPLYNFMAMVVDRGDGPHGTIDPNSGVFYDGDIITLTATPDPNYQVKFWYGTDDDSSTETTNTVSVQGTDVFVAVEFGLAGQGIINLYDEDGDLNRNSPFPTIQDAIDESEPNFTVVVSDGIYTGNGNYNLNLRAGLDVNDVRPITVRSENGPDNCIIDCQGLGRAFIFDSNEDPNYVVDGFTITGGFANFGGAILIDNASPTITNCKILNNTASGDGGGIYMTNSSPIITNTEISYNTAGGFGGGIYGEAESTAEIINCLISFNTSGDIGGAMYLYSSDATITLCTIAFNYGLDYGDLQLYPNPKGGIACRDADPVISNCIIGRNGGTYMFGAWGDPYYSGDDLYNCEATFSCIENGDDAGNNGNIDDDPLWVTGGLGSLYLSQVMSGQAQTSPCVNAGEQYIISNLQATYGLGNITTSIINSPDVGFGDMGYHYPFYTGPPIEYSLQIFAVGNGTVEPNVSPEVHYYAPGTSASIKAIPDPGYRISKWTGTDNDVSVSTLNTVIMYSSRTVFVEFEPAVPRVLNVSTDGQYTYLGIQDAIDDAKEGDIVVLHSGSYAGTGFTVIGKNITITGTNPDDPNAVASTIIDCTNERGGGIHLVGAPGGRCVLNGITIMNSNYSAIDSPGPQNAGDPGIDGSDVVPYAYMDTADGVYTGDGTIMSYSPLTVFGNHVVSNCIIRNCSVEGGDASGGNGGGDDQDGGAGGSGGSAYGGGIYIGDIFDYWYDFNDDPNDPNYGYYEEIMLSWGGSPIIENCIIDNCAAIAGNGANGGTGGNRASGGTGGLSGRAIGGGIYCGQRTSPTFISCTITNSSAIAANGGNGGDGGNPGAGAYGGLTYADPCQPDPELYSANGAGVYCGMMSKPSFIDCTFSYNVTEGSVSGIGGISNPSGIRQQPLRNYNIPSYGAGVYCDSGSVAMFENCNIEGNINTYYNDQYTGYGGGVCLDGSKTGTEAYYYDDYIGSYYPSYLFDDESLGTASATFVGCQIADNSSPVGGGVYAYTSELNVSDCNFADNLSYIGGGLCASDSLAIVTRCDIQRNLASPLADPNTSFDPNDPNDPTGLKFGAGGGIYCAATETIIQDCNITHNIATGSGGGVYLFGNSNAPQIANNLITNNLAGRDGGGISANWAASPFVSNCTFVGNAAAGNFGEPNNTGFGGGFFCSYDSNCVVADSIFWNNFALNGSEIGVGTGFEFDPRPATLTVFNSDAKAGQGAVWVDNGCTLNWEEGNIDADPLFVEGSFGDYYLSQTDAGQLRNSPCVDAGSDYVSALGLIGHTTRTDDVPDTGKVDMGYHHPMTEPCRLCDLAYDGIINFTDFAMLAERWLEQDCSDLNGWCQGTDLTLDSRVNMEDIAFLADCWLVQDTDAPMPDPSLWEIEPYLVSATSVGMTAEAAFDAWGWEVEYYFENVKGNGHDSGWQKSPTYTDTGLTPYVEYGYRVKAKDEIGNETEWSVVRYAGEADTTPPAPAPTWDVEPYAVSPNAISMIATTAFDDNEVEYYFENVSGGGTDSGWQDEPNYTDIGADPNEGLDPNTEYGYRVKARDKSSNRNETGWSAIAYVITPLPADATAPTPDPMEWDPVVDANGLDGTPHQVYRGLGTFDYWAEMTALVATDDSGGAVEYFFECTTESGFSSGWQADPYYTVLLGRSGQGQRFRVKARDYPALNETAWSVEDPAD